MRKRKPNNGGVGNVQWGFGERGRGVSSALFGMLGVIPSILDTSTSASHKTFDVNTRISYDEPSMKIVNGSLN